MPLTLIMARRRAPSVPWRARDHQDIVKEGSRYATANLPSGAAPGPQPRTPNTRTKRHAETAEHPHRHDRPPARRHGAPRAPVPDAQRGAPGRRGRHLLGDLLPVAALLPLAGHVLHRALSQPARRLEQHLQRPGADARAAAGHAPLLRGSARRRLPPSLRWQVARQHRDQPGRPRLGGGLRQRRQGGETRPDVGRLAEPGAAGGARRRARAGPDSSAGLEGLPPVSHAAGRRASPARRAGGGARRGCPRPAGWGVAAVVPVCRSHRPARPLQRPASLRGPLPPGGCAAASQLRRRHGGQAAGGDPRTPADLGPPPRGGDTRSPSPHEGLQAPT